jgi:hypothetical protein
MEKYKAVRKKARKVVSLDIDVLSIANFSRRMRSLLKTFDVSLSMFLETVVKQSCYCVSNIINEFFPKIY